MTSDNKGETLLSSREAAERLGYSYGYFRQLIAAGKVNLTAVRPHPDAHAKWRESEVDALIDQETEAA